MDVGLKLTAGQIIDSGEKEWSAWCNALLDFVCDGDKKMDEQRKSSYCFSWTDCFRFLQKHLPRTENIRDIPLLFEYMPPLRNGRRTDVIMLLDSKVLMMEFKATVRYCEDEIVQTNGYVHYLRTSHDVTLSDGLAVEGHLVRTRDHGEAVGCHLGTVLDQSNFTVEIEKSIAGHSPYPDVEKWVDSETTTIPSIMDAVNQLYSEGKKQEIRYLKDGDLGKSLPFIDRVIRDTQTVGGKSVIIVDGVPGSGKTYLGTQIAFDRKDATPPAVYISGNDPLINYMQTILSPTGSTNIQDDCPFVIGMKTFKRNYIINQRRPQHGVIVFDEAQRAWDAEMMGKGYSEIEGLLDLGDRIQQEHGSCVLVCLFGIGQAIHRGEEKGLSLWEAAISKHQDWHYYVSESVKAKLKTAGTITTHSELHLSTSIRNNFIDMSSWIDSVIDCDDLATQTALLEEAKKKGFYIWITRNLPYWQKYMCANPIPGTYGILASSFVDNKALAAASGGSINSSYMSASQTGAWFTRECRNMNSVASEFVCQGLELDLPFVLFGGDFYLKDGKWEMVIPPSKSRTLADPKQILKNIYRILLSRSRKGMYLVIPENKTLDETYARFVAMGITSKREGKIQ